MRCAFVSACAVLTALLPVLPLPAAATAGALAMPSHRERAAKTIGVSVDLPRSKALAAWAVPIVDGSTGRAVVRVHVCDYTGAPRVGSSVRWTVVTGADMASGRGTTDENGLVTFVDLPSASSNNGEIDISTAEADAHYSLLRLGWSDPDGMELTVQPGRVAMRLTSGGAWWEWTSASFTVESTDGGTVRHAATSAGKSGDVTPVAPESLPGDLEQVSVNFFYDEGTEVSPDLLDGLAVSAGVTTATAVNVDQASCQRMFNFTWASGKPGTTTRVSFQNFPDGWVNRITGVSRGGGSVTSFGRWVSPGGRDWVGRSITIPKSARPGYTYLINARHADGLLSLYEPFQVCTFSPSRSVISRSGRVRFSGRVPFDGKKSKTLIIYRRTTKAGQPARAGCFSEWKGWRRVGTCMAGADGRYTSGWFHPRRTSWYVLWYPEDRRSWGAWTSVARVGVR